MQVTSHTEDKTREQTLHDLLKINHDSFDIVFGGFRVNHMVHHLYVLYSMGADSQRLQRAMNEGKQRLEPLESHGITITKDNWSKYLGDTTSYSAYLRFYEDQFKELGADKLFDMYVPLLLDGSVGAAGHPLIHLGYALEFNDNMVLVEALAMGSTRYVPMGDLVDAPVDNSECDPNIGFADIVAQVAEDKEFDKIALSATGTGFSDKLEAVWNRRDLLRKYYNKVAINEDNLDARLVELFETAVTAYVGSAHHQRPDFFMVHGVTSAHAMSVVYKRLPITERVRLLRVEWLFLLLAYIVQGRPSLGHADEILQPYQQDYPWQRIIAEAIAAKDQHAPKLVYSMMCAEKAFGEQNGRWRVAAALTTNAIRVNDDWEFTGHGYTERQLKSKY
ncbi:hypothetical protein BDF22DRAFT_696244 [Syncephalis plumigaleata]|nr:hypothetical protein BDF22DRAFT_696244 [Syncephalis plumigaleata]